MFTRRLGIKGFLVALLFVSITFATGCGKETVPSTPPLVVSTNPASGATGVLINQVVSATFSGPMNPASVTGTTFTLTGAGGVAVAGTVAYTATGSVATFTPNAALAFNTVYTATITTGVANTLGIESANNLAWSFTTAAQPTVISTVPANGATGVPINQVLSATFSKAMNPATITNATFTLAGPGGAAVTGVVTYNATGSMDTNGYALAANYVWTFTTATRPTVIDTIPVNGATGVPVNQVLSATFSKALNCATVTAASFVVTGAGGTAVAGTVSCAGAVATFTSAAVLATN